MGTDDHSRVEHQRDGAPGHGSPARPSRSGEGLDSVRRHLREHMADQARERASEQGLRHDVPPRG